MAIDKLMEMAKVQAPAAYQDMTWALNWNMIDANEAKDYLERALNLR